MELPDLLLSRFDKLIIEMGHSEKRREDDMAQMSVEDISSLEHKSDLAIIKQSELKLQRYQNFVGDYNKLLYRLRDTATEVEFFLGEAEAFLSRREGLAARKPSLTANRFLPVRDPEGSLKAAYAGRYLGEDESLKYPSAASLELEALLGNGDHLEAVERALNILQEDSQARQQLKTLWSYINGRAPADSMMIFSAIGQGGLNTTALIDALNEAATAYPKQPGDIQKTTPIELQSVFDRQSELKSAADVYEEFKSQYMDEDRDRESFEDAEH